MSLRNAIVGWLRRTGLLRIVGALHQAWLNFVKWTCRVRGKSHMEAIYSDRYFAAEEAWTEPSAQEVVRILIDALKPKSVVDIGCGSAVYLRFFKQAGLEILGYDGSLAAIERAQVDRAHVRHADLTQPLLCERTFDLAICFEVGEHLPAAASDTLVDSMTRLAPVIAFSAAQPGQGGVDHINEQPWTYWAQKFEQRGYRLDRDMTDTLRAAMGRQGSVWWLEKNLFIVRRA